MRPDSPLLKIYALLDTAYGALRDAAWHLDQLDGREGAPGAAYEARAIAEAVTALQRGIDDADAGRPAGEPVRPKKIVWEKSGVIATLDENGPNLHASLPDAGGDSFGGLIAVMRAALDAQRRGSAPTPGARP